MLVDRCRMEGSVMRTATEYQQYAAECTRWANKAKTEAERKAFLDMARAWVQAATRVGGAKVDKDKPTIRLDLRH
jgi:hypothetical protein